MLLSLFAGGDEGGIDFAYCLHVDGGLSVWVRQPGELRFKLGSLTRLMPSPIKGAGNQVRLGNDDGCAAVPMPDGADD